MEEADRGVQKRTPDMAWMRSSLRNWLMRGPERLQALRERPVALLSLLTALTVAPLLTGGATIPAIVGIFSGLGSNVLSDLMTEIMQRPGRAGPPGEAGDAWAGIQEAADAIARALERDDEVARRLKADIAVLFREVDIGAIFRESNNEVRTEIVTAIGALGTGFVELQFLLEDLAQAAGEIQKDLDQQGADIRVIIQQNQRQSVDIRLLRDEFTEGARRAAVHGALAPADVIPRWAGCPYRGLLPFGEMDADIFYGRERLITQLTTMLSAQVASGGPLLVTGASGAGKSSLLKAGLVPKLAEGNHIPGSRDWPRIVMNPTRDPLLELGTRLAAIGGNVTADTVRERLARQPEKAHHIVRAALLAGAARPGQGPGGSEPDRLVLIIDQFEQLFTLLANEDEEDRQAFITALATIATVPGGPHDCPPAVVVIAVRGDFLDRCAEYAELASAMSKSQFVVVPMNESDQRLAITGPAQAAGLWIDPALPDTILADLRKAGGDTAGTLPLLSQAMALTWEKGGGKMLTSRAYEQTGGVAGAVRKSADDAYGELSEARQRLAREVFRAMTVPDRDDRPARLPVTRLSLYALLGEENRADVDMVLDKFATARLLVLDGTNVEISHDALLREWPLLQEWLQDDRDDWILRGQLDRDADAWHRHQEDSSFLYQGTRLVAVIDATARWEADASRYRPLTVSEASFYRASDRAATKSARRRTWATRTLILLVVLALSGVGLAGWQTSIADTQRNSAISNQVAAEALQLSATDPPLAADLDLIAYQRQPTTDIESRLIGLENTPLPRVQDAKADGPTNTVATSRDGTVMVTAASNGDFQLWTASGTGGMMAQGKPHSVSAGLYGGALSPDGQTLVIATNTGNELDIWNTADPANPVDLGLVPIAKVNGRETANSLAFSPNGRYLAVGATDRRIYLLDMSTPADPRRVAARDGTATGYVSAAAFSPDGTILATGGWDGVVRLWKVSADGALSPDWAQQMYGDDVTSLSFSRQGHLLAIGDQGELLTVVSVASPAHSTVLDQVNTVGFGSGVAFSPDSQVLASTGKDDEIQLWNAADPEILEQLGPPLGINGGTVMAMAFTADGMLASGNNNDTIAQWTVPKTLLIGPTNTVHGVAFASERHPGTSVLMAGGYDGAVRLWNVTNPATPGPESEIPVPATDPSAHIIAVALSPNGQVLATATDDEHVFLRNVNDPASAPLSVLTTAAIPLSATFSPDERTLVVAEQDAGIQVYNVTDPRGAFAESTAPDLEGSAVAFNPKGNLLAVGDSDGTITLLNAADGFSVLGKVKTQTVDQSLSGLNAVSSLSFSHDGKVLADGNVDGTVQLWNVTHPGRPAQDGPVLVAGNDQDSGSVDAVAISGNDQWLIAGYDEGTVGAWNIRTPTKPQELGLPFAASATGAVDAVAFDPLDPSWIATAGYDDTVRLWDLNVTPATDHICSATDVLTRKLWATYVPQAPYQAPCR